jgi:hypothetical protein
MVWRRMLMWELPTFKQRWQHRCHCLATESKQRLLGKASKQLLLGKAYNNKDSDMFYIRPTLCYISSSTILVQCCFSIWCSKCYRVTYCYYSSSILQIQVSLCKLCNYNKYYRTVQQVVVSSYNDIPHWWPRRSMDAADSTTQIMDSGRID